MALRATKVDETLPLGRCCRNEVHLACGFRPRPSQGFRRCRRLPPGVVPTHKSGRLSPARAGQKPGGSLKGLTILR